MTEEAKEMWTIEELVQKTEEVQSTELEWQGKALKIQWCELVEAEEPKMTLPDDATSEEQQQEFYKKIAGERVLAMISKANKKNPEGTTLTEDNWGSLPTTFRWQIQTTVLSVDKKESF